LGAYNRDSKGSYNIDVESIAKRGRGFELRLIFLRSIRKKENSEVQNFAAAFGSLEPGFESFAPIGTEVVANFVENFANFANFADFGAGNSINVGESPVGEPGQHFGWNLSLNLNFHWNSREFEKKLPVNFGSQEFRKFRHFRDFREFP